MELRIQALIVPALLEYEEISGVSGGAPRGRAQSVADGAPAAPEPRSPAHLAKDLTQLKSTLVFFGVDPGLILQIFKQVDRY